VPALTAYRCRSQELDVNADAKGGVCPMRAPGSCGGKTIGSHHLDSGWTLSGAASALRLTVQSVVAPGGKPAIAMKAYLIGA